MELPKRKNVRLKEYDYSQSGVYFVTVCTNDKKHILGHISRENPCGCPCIYYTKLGEIAKNQIKVIENKYHIKFEKYVIMPNHIHAMIMIDKNTFGQPQGLSLQKIIGGYKSLVSTEYLKQCKEKNIKMGKIWQSRYYDHIIRNQNDYDEIWQYIDTNPLKWELDCYYIKNM